MKNYTVYLLLLVKALIKAGALKFPSLPAVAALAERSQAALERE